MCDYITVSYTHLVLPDRVYVPDYISFDKYVKVDCEEKSYKVPTDSTFSTRYYCCIVNYEIDGKTYSSKSKFTEIAVVSNELEIPEIENQPQSISWIKGKPLTETLDVSLKTVVGQGNAQYQWYENTENNNESGIAVAGATKSSYKPPVSEAGTTYYYCQIWYERNDLLDVYKRQVLFYNRIIVYA